MREHRQMRPATSFLPSFVFRSSHCVHSPLHEPARGESSAAMGTCTESTSRPSKKLTTSLSPAVYGMPDREKRRLYATLSALYIGSFSWFYAR